MWLLAYIEILLVIQPVSRGLMGNLAKHLQDQFYRHCPTGWRVEHEVSLVSREVSRLLGYTPRVDVLLEREDTNRRLWIEFEISRADPVANHAKFATAHLFAPQAAGDLFLSMMSPHVKGGRRNLAANMVLAMRNQGMMAFQTVLLPYHRPTDIKRLNYLPLEMLLEERLDVAGEIERALTVTEPTLNSEEGSIHFAGNIIEALLNAYRWNKDMETPEGHQLWGHRTVTYFVYDPRFRHFAPSKYCAYVLVTGPRANARERVLAGMTVERYTRIERSNRIFDGTRARRHLVDNLGMQLVAAEAQPRLEERFEAWLASCRENISVHPVGPQIILPPPWF